MSSSRGLLLALACGLGVQATPVVNVGMRAAFSAGPYLLELLETAAGENETAYFPLLDRVAEGRFAKATTDTELYDTFLQVVRDDGHITDTDALSTFNLALSLRSSAPRIEAHYQYYSTAVEPALDWSNQQDCSSWVQLDHQQFCSPSLDDPQPLDGLKGRLLPYDRSLEPVASQKNAILYADPLSPTFARFHKSLSEAAKEGKLSYTLRYRRAPDASVEPLPVSGYGVELALKRTDYIVIDDRDENSEQLPTGDQEIGQDADGNTDVKPLSSSELAELGAKTASYISTSADSFGVLLDLLQDFPKHSSFLSKQDVSDAFITESEKNRGHAIPAGISYLWINGMQLAERQIQPFALVDLLRRERSLLRTLRNLKFNGQEAVSLLGHPKVAASKDSGETQRVDWTDRLEEGNAIIWLNDLEKDDAYADFATSVSALLQRTYPGQLPGVARNMFNIVLPADLTNEDDLGAIAQLASLIQRGIPLRVGLVPLTASDDAKDQAKVAYHLMKSFGIEAFTNYLREFVEGDLKAANEGAYLKAIAGLENASDLQIDWKEILGSETQAHQLELAANWAKRVAAGSDTRSILINGVSIPRQGNWMRTMSMKVNEDLQVLQQNVYQHKIDDETSIPDFFLENAISRRNIYITPESPNSIQILDVSKLYKKQAALFNQIPVLKPAKGTKKEDWAVLTVVADLTSTEGVELLLSALALKRDNPGVRLDIINNPDEPTERGYLNSLLVEKVDKLAGVSTQQEFADFVVMPQGTSETYGSALTAFLKEHGFASGESLIILNGRVVGPIAPGDSFTTDDFTTLLNFERKARIMPVMEAIDDLGFADKLSCPMCAAKISSLIALSTESDLPEGIFEAPPGVRTNLYEQWESKHTAIEVGNAETATVLIAGLLDPASEQAQKWAPVLKILSEVEGVYLKLWLNPKERMSELPVKRFYRYVMESKPSFNEDGSVKAINATFEDLPSEVLLTAGMDVPPAWLVAPKHSIHDLDNVKLSSVKTDIEAMYELENILVEGHSREGSGAPPKGAQLVLGTEKESHVTDTIVMANLGFFQFKANPGFYNIHLKEGRSADIYDIESVGAKGNMPVAGDEGTDVAVMDFQGTTLYPRLIRKPGQEDTQVLEPQDDSKDESVIAKGFKLANSLLGKKSVSDEEHAEINIFSVASGHLYERMLNIMMVSVMKHTKHTVKFWFIEQFLSPEFKDSIPHLAEEYGFKYQMVTYKWPHWLRQQKEKQREIWGYKILFLDVLFPLSLDKVIFVDADQIVRTDMIDLVRHDLEGAPYGFTPMCDSRESMEGFRFWKQGYWATYLRGLPYHISALYVVDLLRFRALAAGDRLRQQYHALSADPNSLANLDQDLPNNMQFQIPIHSLPQEWLWCETWCSDESLGEARTIDLCNNPLTKEPKLDRARRQVPEWNVYDEEIKSVLKRRMGGEAVQEAIEKATKEEEEGSREEPQESTNTKSRRFEGESPEKDEL